DRVTLAFPARGISILPRGNINGLVKLLLDAGVNVDTPGRNGGSALLWAVKQGNVTVVRLLLNKGSRIETRDLPRRGTPLRWAAQRGHVEAVKLLILDRADDGAFQKRNSTPLSIALVARQLRYLRSLLANAHLRNSPGVTSVFTAIKQGQVRRLRELFGKGEAARVGDIDLDLALYSSLHRMIHYASVDPRVREKWVRLKTILSDRWRTPTPLTPVYPPCPENEVRGMQNLRSGLRKL
ncbi:MAG: hypothetical protein M1839_002992, partial [Geoglossum umbratile]